MAIFGSRATRIREAVEANAALLREAPATHAATIDIPSWDEFQAVNASTAYKVPSFARGAKLITGTVAQLPLVQWRTGVMVAGTGLLSQPEADKPYWVTIQRTTQDLLLYGRAFWEVRDTDAEGFPTIVRWLPAVDVSTSKAKPGYVTYDNHDYPISAPYGPGTNVGAVIVFDGYGKGVLEYGAETIRLALALEASAAHYAATPLPQIALKNAGADLTPEQITKLLTEWENARVTRTTAYLSSVMETETYGWNAAELQLVDARNAQASMVARLLNLDPLWVGASVPGSSLSYANRVDLRKDLVDLTLSDFMSPIEQRLSMRDVTPTITNNIVRFNTNEFLRSNLESRVAMVTQLAPYPEILTTDEAREFLQDSPNGMGYPS